MKTEIKQLQKSEVNLIITVSPEELEKYETEAATRISQAIEVPGFRKGQAPKAFVIAQVGEEKFFEEVVNVAIPHSFYKAVQENKIQMIARPQVKLVTKSPFVFEARTAISPEIKLNEPEKIKIPAGKTEITPKEIDEVIEEMRKYRATFEPLDRAIKVGDRVEIDFQGYDEAGAALDKTKSSNHPLFVGEGSLIPGFEEHLVGMKTGEKKKFPIKFPKDFHHEPLRAKNVHFEVEVKKAEKANLPELNDTFVEQILGKKSSTDEFRAAVKSDLEARKVVEERRDRENKLLEKLLKEAKFDVPPLLAEEEAYYMLDDLARELKARGLEFKTYLEQVKKDEKTLLKEYLPEAERRVRIRLILSHLFGVMKIEVSESEMKDASAKVIERTNEKEQAHMQDELGKKGEIYLRLKNNIMLEKLFARFFD